MAFRRTTRGRKATGAKKTSWGKKTTFGGKKGVFGRNSRVKTWSATEIAFLRKEYRTCTNGQLAKKLGRSVASVRAKAGALNLNKSSNFLSMVARTAGNGGWAKAGSKVLKTWTGRGRRG